MPSSPDVVIIGSGVGGGTLANRLVQHGLRVTILERGDYLPQEPENWDVNAVFASQKYVPLETWLDKEGTAFRPHGRLPTASSRLITTWRSNCMGSMARPASTPRNHRMFPHIRILPLITNP